MKEIKLDNKKSRFSKEEEQPQVSFETQVAEAHEKKLGYQQEIFDLGLAFINSMKDKTLLENRLPIGANLEKENLNKLIQFAIKVNNDSNEPEGMGSVGLLTLIFKSLLLFRDNLNAVEYTHKSRIEKLESRILELEKQLLERKS